LGVVLSYFWLTQKKYTASLLILILAGMVKYVSWLLLPIPLFYLLTAQAPLRNKFIQIGLVGGASFGIAEILYLPYGGLSWDVLRGLFHDMRLLLDVTSLLPGTLLLQYLFHFPLIVLRLIGIAFGEFALVLCLWKKRPALAYVLPFVLIFFFATPWFQPWYLTWIVMLLPLVIPIDYIPWLLVAFFCGTSLYIPGLIMTSIILGLASIYRYITNLPALRFSQTKNQE
jgi:hypothetical protein